VKSIVEPELVVRASTLLSFTVVVPASRATLLFLKLKKASSSTCGFH
jgi:hypothetical protein